VRRRILPLTLIPPCHGFSQGPDISPKVEDNDGSWNSSFLSPSTDRCLAFGSREETWKALGLPADA